MICTNRLKDLSNSIGQKVEKLRTNDREASLRRVRRYGVAVEKLRKRGGFGTRVRNGGSIICRREMGGVARGDAWSGAGGWAERRRGMRGVVRGRGRSGAEGCVEWRGRMRGAARGMGELRGNEGGGNEKDAVLKGRTRRLQTLNSVWKGNYCSGIGDGGAIKSTKQREASAVPYRFVMVIPSVMKLSSPK